ncbi:MAG: hypothetical protein GPJ10_01560 [Microcystis aeruginosa L211-07]|jgi:hypothetical protein|nr:hypothetical protein [Microcystis aeruginosa L211-07]
MINDANPGNPTVVVAKNGIFRERVRACKEEIETSVKYAVNKQQLKNNFKLTP